MGTDPFGNPATAAVGVHSLQVAAVLVGCLLALGCESGESGNNKKREDPSREQKLDQPVLPEAPWFELPADWAEQHPTLSPNARPEIHWMALAERQIPHDPADSAGRVWLEAVTPTSGPASDRHSGNSGETPSLPAASHQRFELVFEVGEPGIADGGSLFVLPDPFWYWSEAQTGDPAAPGYTTAVLREPAGVDGKPARLVATELPGAFRIAGRALAAGEKIAIVYGAGPAGATVDRYAERGAEIRIGLDADGDGRRAWLPESVVVDITAREGALLIAFAPAEVAPGERFELNLALVDAVGNRARWPAAALDASGRSRAEFSIESLPAATLVPSAGLGVQTSVAPADSPHHAALVVPGIPAAPAASGAPAAPIAAAIEGVLRLRVRGRGPLAAFEAELPPIVVRRAPTHLVWADLHGHTRYSDGSGAPDDYFRYARDVARLEVIALTDHDHWGLSPLDENPARQAEIVALAKTYHEPGRFVTLPGYEWTSWLHGHRHVLAFDDELPMFSALDPASDRPDELWAALRGRPVLTFAHHSAGAPIATDWNFAPDPELEPVTEIVSVHGSSEAADAPAPIDEAIEGNFVRDVLLHGARLGFIGSGDSHDGHPGLAEISAGQGGLAGIFTAGLDRAHLLSALKRRHTFATNGIRPWLEVSIDGVAMGGTLVTTASPDPLLRIRYEATAPIESVELIRSSHRAKVELPPPPVQSLDLERRIPALHAGEFHYVRIVQTDGGVAWSSPIFADPSPAAAATTTTTTKKLKRSPE